MAIHIPRRFLTDQHISVIQKMLLIKPVQKFNNFGNKKTWFMQKQRDDLVNEPVFMYKSDKNSDDDNYLVQLPYTFARILLDLPIPNYHPTVSYQFTSKLYESQVQVVGDAIQGLNNHGSCILNLYTGFGKTVVSAYLGAWSQKITLVLYTNTILEPQWESTFRDFTNARIWIVKPNNPPPPEGPHVILCMNTRFQLLSREYVKNIGTVIYDEADTFCTPGRVNCLLGVTPKYVIAATATLQRDDGMHAMMESVCGISNIIRKISKKPFIVYKYRTGIEIEQVKNRQGVTDWSKVTLDQSTSKERNLLIYSLIKCNMDSKILVLTWRKSEHVIPLAIWLRQMGINVDYMAGTKKNYQDSQVLVGTISKIGRGFDEKAACDNYNGIRINLLILVGSTKSVKLLEQVAGRAFRSDFPQIIHFVDECSISKNHWYVAKPWYESRNGTVKEVFSPYYRKNKVKIENPHSHTEDTIIQQQLANFEKYRKSP